MNFSQWRCCKAYMRNALQLHLWTAFWFFKACRASGWNRCPAQSTAMSSLLWEIAISHGSTSVHIQRDARAVAFSQTTLTIPKVYKSCPLCAVYIAYALHIIHHNAIPHHLLASSSACCIPPNTLAIQHPNGHSPKLDYKHHSHPCGFSSYVLHTRCSDLPLIAEKSSAVKEVIGKTSNQTIVVQDWIRGW